MQDPTEKHVSDVGILVKYNYYYYYYYSECISTPGRLKS
jgi:hypothetical protein